jgi:hypothetical protein
MRLSPAPVGHSARVRLSLRASGHVVPLSQVGPDFCISREPVELLPQKAEIVVQIDGEDHVYPVYLPKGMSAASQKSMIELLSNAPIVAS